MARLTKRLVTHTTPEFETRLQEESFTTHVPMPTLIRQLLAEALELREVNRITLPQRMYYIMLTPREAERLSRLGYQLTKDEDTDEAT